MSEHRHRSSRQPPARLEGRPDVGQRPVALGPQGAILGLQRSSGNAAVRDLLARSAVRDTAGPDTADRQVQRFGGKEHRNIGDWATNRKLVTLGSRGYQLSYGEMIALAGDLFPSHQYMEKLADRRGPGPDTQEALDYARFIKIGPPPRNPGRPHSAGASYRENMRRRGAGSTRPANAASPPCRRWPLDPSVAISSPTPSRRGTYAPRDRTSSRTGTGSTIGHRSQLLGAGLVTRFQGFMMMQVSEWIPDNRQRCNLLAPASSTPLWPMASRRRWPAGPR